MLFDDISREFKGLPSHTEPLFSYLNRSGRPSITRIRELLESWFCEYPSDAQAELATRFRSIDDIQHRSAFFELYLHALLIRLGYQVLVHPEIPDCNTQPDFLVLRNRNPITYLEATLATGPSEETAADKRKNVVYETLDKMNSPNFWVGIEVESSTAAAPPGRKWSGQLERWLAELDPDAIGEQLKPGGLEDMPQITLSAAGWKVNFRAIPKSPAARGERRVRPLGLYNFGFQECKEDEWIKNAIKEKATRYGDLSIPYLIAINILSIFSRSNFMIMDALFGKEGFTVYRLPDGGFDHRPSRAPNGAFRGPKGPHNTRVSGVIICNDLSSGGIAKIGPVLWHNPWATYPIIPDLWPLTQWILSDDKTGIVPTPGREIAEIFGLSKDWPILDIENDIEY